MLENQKFRPAQVIGPLGEPLTIDSLPPPQTNRSGFAGARKKMTYVTNVTAMNRTAAHRRRLMR